MLDAQTQHQSQRQAYRREGKRLADDHYSKLPRPKTKSFTNAEFISALQYSHENRVEYSQPYHRQYYAVHDVVKGVVQPKNLGKHRD